MNELKNTGNGNKPAILNDPLCGNLKAKESFYSKLSISLMFLGLFFDASRCCNMFLSLFAKYAFLASTMFGITALAKMSCHRRKSWMKYANRISVFIGILYMLSVSIFYDLGKIRTDVSYMRRIGNVKLQILGKEVIRYSEKHDGYLPDANQWCDLLIKNNPSLTREDFKHPFIKGFECNFAFDKNLSGLRFWEIPKDVVLLFEADGEWNLNGTKELLKKRHWLDNYILLVDQNTHLYNFEDHSIIIYDPFIMRKPLRWKP